MHLTFVIQLTIHHHSRSVAVEWLFRHLDLIVKSTGNLPEVIIHRLEEKLVIRSVQGILEIPECHPISRHRKLDQIRGIFVVYVVDDFCFPHPEGCAEKIKTSQ